jgi:hypothetical protein
MAKKKTAKKKPSHRQNLTDRLQAKFLGAYSQCGSVTRACQLSGVNRKSHYNWISDPEYKERFQEAHREAIAELEMEARRRAVAGVRKLHFHKGMLICIPDENGNMVPYVEHVYSDNLLMFLLKAASPKKYRDNVKMESTSTVQILKGDKSPLPTRDEALARYAELIAMRPENASL